MDQPTGVAGFRFFVGHHLGNRVRIRRNCGRHRIDYVEGTLKEAYPSIFVVELERARGDGPRNLSFSYTDLLTRDIQMMLCQPVSEQD